MNAKYNYNQPTLEQNIANPKRNSIQSQLWKSVDLRYRTYADVKKKKKKRSNKKVAVPFIYLDLPK